ncbi:MAG: aspartate kinase [Oscillospiraceae bacterium]|nr:aspartate kinase [Oscillospiraceae bacterium]
MVVVKFGGSSLADAEHIDKVFEIVRSDRERKVVVVSAPGKRGKSDQKVTDLLIGCATARINGGDARVCLDALLARYRGLVESLGLDGELYAAIEADFYDRLARRGAAGMHDAAFIDLMKAAGEDNNAKLIAAYFNKRGLPSVYVNPKDAGFYMSESFGNAQILPESYANIANHIKGICAGGDAAGASSGGDTAGTKAVAGAGGVVASSGAGGDAKTIIFPGFFGFTKSGLVITFSRGGSDVTGSVLAAALDASLYENFTDVDHVCSVDPSLVKDPLPIHEITYREMRELSYAGFQVYHEDALVPVFEKSVPVHIKNTNNPSGKGTIIVKGRARNDGKCPITGISSAKGFLCVHISKLMMNIEIGFGKKVLQIIEDENVPFEHMPSGIDNISIIMKESLAQPEAVEKIVGRIKSELFVDEVTVRRGLAIVMLVGEGMLHTVGTAARASSALANSSINIEIINQGSSEVSLMFGVDAKDADASVISLYNEFFAHDDSE